MHYIGDMVEDLIKKYDKLLKNFNSIKKFKNIKIRSKADFKKIPITTRDEISEFSLKDCPANPVSVFTSSGTTGGKKIYVYFSKEGYDYMLKRVDELFSHLKITKKDCFLNLFTLGSLFCGGLLCDEIARKRDMLTIPVGEPKQIKQDVLIDIIKRMEPTFIATFPSQLYGLFSEIKKKHKIKKCFVGGELLVDEYIKIIKNLSGIDMYDLYACNEVGAMAIQAEKGKSRKKKILTGLHMEVMNDKGISDVGEGDILVTDLNNLSTPIIRYKIGDYGRITKEGNNKYVEIFGRKGSTININGELHSWPNLINMIFKSIGHPCFCVFIKKDVKSYNDKFIVVIEKESMTTKKTIEDIKKEFSNIRIWPKVKITKEQLPKTVTGKFIHLVDLRKKLLPKDMKKFSF